MKSIPPDRLEAFRPLIESAWPTVPVIDELGLGGEAWLSKSSVQGWHAEDLLME